MCGKSPDNRVKLEKQMILSEFKSMKNVVNLTQKQKWALARKIVEKTLKER